jgi:hypothetical protein
MSRILAIFALAIVLAVPAHAAEGRRTAAVGGFIVGAVSGFLVRDAMAQPAPRERVVYVEAAPAPVVREVVVVREVPPPTRTVVIIVEGRDRAVADNGFGWRPAPVRPFPQ